MGKIVRCCVVLHNMLMDEDEAAEILDFVGDPNLEEEDGDDDHGLGHGLQDQRQQLVRTF